LKTDDLLIQALVPFPAHSVHCHSFWDNGLLQKGEDLACLTRDSAIHIKAMGSIARMTPSTVVEFFGARRADSTGVIA
jgi:hypothetical protein